MELGGRATSQNQSLVRNPIAAGQAQSQNAKDHKDLVHISPVQSAVAHIWEWSGLVAVAVALFGRQRTGLDQTFKH